MKHVLLGSLLLLVLCTTGCNRSPGRDYSLIDGNYDPPCEYDSVKEVTVCNPSASQKAVPTSLSGEGRRYTSSAPSNRKATAEESVTEIRIVPVVDDGIPEWSFELPLDAEIVDWEATPASASANAASDAAGNSGSAVAQDAGSGRQGGSNGSAGGGNASGFGGGGGFGGGLRSAQEEATDLSGNQDAKDALNVNKQRDADVDVTEVPEPHSIVLLGAGLLLLGLHWRRTRNHSLRGRTLSS